MAKALLKLTKTYEVDLDDEDMKLLLEEALTELGTDGAASDSEVRDAIQNQLGEDMASLIDLDEILDSDFEITVPSDHGLHGYDSPEGAEAAREAREQGKS